MPTGKILLEGLLGAATIGVHVVFTPLLRASRMKWGATPDELRQPMPGDDLAPHPQFIATRAVTIHAPASKVWQWLVQLGCQRGGWYSYDLLDNGGVPSIDLIDPALQNLREGDMLAMTPDGKMKMPVTRIEPGRALVLGGTINTRTGGNGDINDPNLREYFNWVMAYAVQPIDAQTTRLVTRNRAGWNSSFGNTIAFGWFVEAIAFVMETKMMQGIKARAESHV